MTAVEIQSRIFRLCLKELKETLRDRRTILGFQSTATMDGYIPDRVVVRWSFRRLKELLGDVASRAKEVVPKHYTGDHAPLTGGDGRPLELYAKDR